MSNIESCRLTSCRLSFSDEMTRLNHEIITIVKNNGRCHLWIVVTWDCFLPLINPIVDCVTREIVGATFLRIENIFLLIFFKFFLKFYKFQNILTNWKDLYKFTWILLNILCSVLTFIDFSDTSCHVSLRIKIFISLLNDVAYTDQEDLQIGTHPELCLWGYLKSKVYIRDCETIDQPTVSFHSKIVANRSSCSETNEKATKRAPFTVLT